MRWHFAWLALLVGLGTPGCGLAAPKTQARLLLPSEMAQPGETILAGVELIMAPEWHTYWRNGGDAGAPTKIEWELPPGLSAGEILWPVPEKHEEGELVTYVYHDRVVLLVPLTVQATAEPGKKMLVAKVSWLECHELCLPGKASLQTTLDVGPTAKPGRHAALLQEAQRQIPLPSTNLIARVEWTGPPSAAKRGIKIGWETREGTARVDFYPHGSPAFDVSHRTEQLHESGGLIIRKTVEKLEGSWPATLRGLLVEKDADGKTVAAYEVTLPLHDEKSQVPH